MLMQNAWDCYRESRFAAAEHLILQAIEVREEVLGANHRKLVPMLDALAKVRNEQRRYAEAEAALQRALGILRSRSRASKVREIEVLSTYVETLTLAEKPDQRKAVESELRAYQDAQERLPAFMKGAAHLTRSFAVGVLRRKSPWSNSDEIEEDLGPLALKIAVIAGLLVVLVVLILQTMQ